NTVRLESIAEEEEKNKNYKKAKKAKRALYIIEHFDNALSTILIGNNLVNIASSSLGSVFIILLFKNDSLTWISTVVLTIAIIIFGESIPKITAKKNAITKSLSSSSLLRFLMVVLWPVVFVTVGFVNLISKVIKGEQISDEENLEELQSIIETAEDEGIIDENDSLIMQAAIDFYDISASEAMTSRVDMLAIDIDDSWEEILEIANNSTYSRIPVYENSIDNIIGILHLNKFFKALSEYEEKKKENTLFEGENQEGNYPINIRDLLMTPSYVYKTMKLPKVLNTLKNAKQHLAIVTDEYSGTLGLITMEDVLEQIVGEIYDETDVIEEEVIQKSDNEFELDGDLPIGEFLDLVGLNEDSFDFESETVGGWCVETIGDFPHLMEVFHYKDMEITILAMDGLRVAKILVRRIPNTVEESQI
ncbi:MAG: HlyC/CorC family transporter, partial [Sphaerochaetaceae bacterium]|nr:HlyC/CorC family transporter [Sphaerochaetaceae bacterium]